MHELQHRLEARPRRRRGAWTVALAVTLALAARTVDAQLTVTRLYDLADPNPGDGQCGRLNSVGSRICTLRAAIQEANALNLPQTITLPRGVYTLTIEGTGEDFAATGDLDIRKEMIIQPSSGPVVIDANGIDRVFDVFAPFNCQPVCVTLSGMTIRGGSATEGGGIRARTGLVELSYVLVTDNQANIGGGVYVDAATFGLEVWGSAVEGNAALLSGGGLYNAGGLRLLYSIVARNSALNGGGLFNTGSASLGSTTVSGNAGSGILHDAVGPLSLDHVTLVGNQGSALDPVSASPWSASNSLLVGGCSQPGALQVGEGNLESPGDTCGLDVFFNQVDVVDPGLRPLANYGGSTETHALCASSPARDAGLGSCLYDQRLALRTDGSCDVGAFEYGAQPPDGGIFAHGFESGDIAAWSP